MSMSTFSYFCLAVRCMSRMFSIVACISFRYFCDYCDTYLTHDSVSILFSTLVCSAKGVEKIMNFGRGTHTSTIVIKSYYAKSFLERKYVYMFPVLTGSYSHVLKK